MHVYTLLIQQCEGRWLLGWDHFNLSGRLLVLSIFVAELSAANIEQHPHFVPI